MTPVLTSMPPSERPRNDVHYRIFVDLPAGSSEEPPEQSRRVPMSESIEANSQPIAPPPITTCCLRQPLGSSTSSLVSTKRPSTSKPGIVRGTEPAARMTADAVSSVVPPSGPRLGPPCRATASRCRRRSRPLRRLSSALAGRYGAGRSLSSGELSRQKNVDRPAIHANAVLLGALHCPVDSGRFQQFLGWDTTTVQNKCRPPFLSPRRAIRKPASPP